VVNIGAATLTLAETTLSTPTQSVLLISAGSAGTKIEEIDIMAITTSATNLAATTAAGLVYLFLWDGASAYHLRDTIPVSAVTASATVAPFQASRTYANLWIPSGYSLRASSSVALAANSALKVTAFGGDY
jgi:hypothetical protein